MIHNFAFWIVLFCVCFACGMFFGNFVKKSKAQKIAMVKEWLVYMVAVAEQELGSGTGRLKLGQVYDEFVRVFPGVAKWVSFEMFAKLVDDALKEFQELIINNMEIAEIFGAEPTEEIEDIVEEEIDEE